MQAVKGAWRRFLGFLEGGNDDDEWEEEVEYVEYDEPVESVYDEGLDLAGMDRRDRNRKKKSSNVLEFDSRRDPETQTVVRVSRPKELKDATLICDYLHDNMICIVDMHGVDQEKAQRIADYLGGVTYALRGQVERIDSKIFVMAPESAKITADLKADLETGGWLRSFATRG